MNSKRMFSVMLTSVLLIASVLPTYGATTQDQIKDARAAKEKNESNLSDTKNRIDNLQSKKNESESYLSELNTQLEELKNSLEQLQKDSEAKQSELETVQSELQEAKMQEAKQYDRMKIRIQFMYENSGTGYLEMLLSASDFTEFLNRAENISQISEYDRNMLKDYQATKDKIKEKEEEVRTEKAAIEVLRQESAQKQGEVEDVVASTYNQINAYSADIQGAESEEAVLLSKISEQEESINGLLKQAKEEAIAAEKARLAEEKAQQQAAEASKKTTTPAKVESKKAAPIESKSDDEESSSESTDTKSSQVEETTPSSDDTNEPEETTVEETKSNSSESDSSGSNTYLGSFKMTAYCSCSKCCGSWAGGATASGTTPTAGRTVAMGGIPFGTKLLINGNVYTVEDRGTAYGHVDVFMGSHSQALSFGMQYADVYIVN